MRAFAVPVTRAIDGDDAVRPAQGLDEAGLEIPQAGACAMDHYDRTAVSRLCVVYLYGVN